MAGTLNLQNTITLGSAGSTIQNTGSINIANNYNGPGPVNVTVAGNLKNSGSVVVGDNGPCCLPPSGATALSINGVLTNQTNGTLNVQEAGNPFSPLPGSLSAQRLVNNGLAMFQAGTSSAAQFVQNSGTLNIYGDHLGDIGQLTTTELDPKAGKIWVLANGGTLIVGSGAVVPGTMGYMQFANGILDEGGGMLQIDGPASLNGTPDIMLGNGAKPVGTVFDVLTAQAGALTGTFLTVDGLTFDGGRQRYILDYDYTDGIVSLTVGNNTPGTLNAASLINSPLTNTAAPEPASLGIASLSLAALAVLRSRYRQVKR